MDGLKKLVIRLLMFAAFGSTVFFIAHEIAGYVVETKYSKIIEQDLVKLATIVENDNVLSTDTFMGKSQYKNFTNKVLRSSEDHILKYDVAVASLGVQNNDAIDTTTYLGAIDPSNPIKIYYLDENANEVRISSYLDCPNRGEVVFIELTGDVYVPVMIGSQRTKDVYSTKNHRKLVKITKKTSVICSNFYKGK